MRKEIANRVIEHMASYYDGGIEELKAELEHYMHDRVKGEYLDAYRAGVTMTEDGCFAVCYNQVEERGGGKPISRYGLNHEGIFDEEPETFATATSLKSAMRAVAEFKRHNNMGKEVRGQHGDVMTPSHETFCFNVYYVEWIEIEKVELDEEGEEVNFETVYSSNYYLS